MLATAGAPPSGPDWVIEPKFDGARCVTRIDEGRVDMFSRRSTNLTASFPELAEACSALRSRGAILDGEIIVLDRQGQPRFSLLQRRLHVGRPAKSLLSGLRASLMVFDVVYLDGRDLTGLPYRERRAVLESLQLEEVAPVLATSPAWPGMDGHEVLAAMVDAGMEGIVTKAAGSTYKAGYRSRHWIKTPYRSSGYFVVGGFIPTSAHAGSIGALLVGAHDATGNFVYCGTLTVGFTEQQRRELYRHLFPLVVEASPFHSVGLTAHDGRVRWVTPLVVGRVEYRDFTGRLRHPAWKGVASTLDSNHVGLPAVR